MKVYIDTCVLPRCRLEEAAVYTKRFGGWLGFELLPMFDLPDWEENLKKNLPLFAGRPLIFHEPGWGVEPSAPQDSPAWKEGMKHLLLTRQYAEILHPTDMVCHLNNSIVSPEEKDRMLENAAANLEEIRRMFPGVRLLVENTGIRAEGSQLLDQEEFARECIARGWDVLIDVGHANANGWDVFRLVTQLKDRIRGFHLHNNDGAHDLHNRILNGTLGLAALLPFIAKTVPDAFLVIEYCRPELHGLPLLEDIEALRSLIGTKAGQPAERKPAWR